MKKESLKAWLWMQQLIWKFVWLELKHFYWRVPLLVIFYQVLAYSISSTIPNAPEWISNVWLHSFLSLVAVFLRNKYYENKEIAIDLLRKEKERRGIE